MSKKILILIIIILVLIVVGVFFVLKRQGIKEQTPKPVCGNGSCEVGETPWKCPEDCKTSSSENKFFGLHGAYLPPDASYDAKYLRASVEELNPDYTRRLIFMNPKDLAEIKASSASQAQLKIGRAHV